MEETKETPAIDYEAEYNRLKDENEKLRTANTKTSADVSKLKKDLSELMSKDELAKREREEKALAMETELAQYKERERIANYTAQLMACGYDPETAKAMAGTLPDGVPKSYFDSAKAFRESEIAKIKAEALNSMPQPTTGKAPTSGEAEDKLTNAILRGAGLLK